MVLSKLLAVGLWLGVTLASTAMVWTATSIVAADVTDRPPSVVAHEDVVSELASGPPVATTAPATTTTTRPPATTTTVRVQPPAPTTTVPRPVVTAAPVTPVPVPTTPPPTTAPRPTAPTTPTTTRPTATYATVGGVVRVACNGLLIELISAIPNNGYSARVPVNGPANVEVRFTSTSGQTVTVRAVCFGEPIRYS